jgi:hypothetical protein
MLWVVLYRSMRWDFWEGVCRISESFVGSPKKFEKNRVRGWSWQTMTCYKECIISALSYFLLYMNFWKYAWKWPVIENCKVWINFAHLNPQKLRTLFQTKGSCSYFVQHYLQYLPKVLCGVCEAFAYKFKDEHSNSLCCQQYELGLNKALISHYNEFPNWMNNAQYNNKKV